jgi:polysaccharide biosynthesis/export protein
MSHQEYPKPGSEAAPGPAPAVKLSLWRWISKRFRRPQQSDLSMMISLAVLTVLFVGVALLFFGLVAASAHAAPLTVGDRLQLIVEAGDEFSGRFQVDIAGRIQLPIVGGVPIQGLEPEAANEVIAERLVDAGLFKRSFIRTSLQVLYWAPLDVRVSGAVYYAGAHRINTPPTRERAPDRTEDLPGAGIPERRLSDALRAAGGVTLWADVAHVAVRRQGQTRLYDLWGLLMGHPGDDPSLQTGDEVLVPLAAEAQPQLARPSAITPPGIKVFISNLIQPAQSNAQATAQGGSVSLQYGARFSQAAVAANCAGGIATTSASRNALLVRTDRLNGTTQHWERPIEVLLRKSRDEDNPVLLEGDAVTCYDSQVTSVRDVFRAIADVLLPFSLLRRLP